MSSSTRRQVIKKGGTGLAAVITVSGGLLAIPEATVAANGLTADDVSVTTNDGNLNELTIAPDVTISWSNQPTQVAQVDATWHVESASNSGTIGSSVPYQLEVGSPSTDGSLDHTFSTINLLSSSNSSTPSTGPLDASNFAASSDGTTTSRDVTIWMDVVLRDSESNEINSKNEVLGPTTFTVSVTNDGAAASISSSGVANTNGS